MKTWYLFVAILACNVIGLATASKGLKSAMAALSGAVAVYGIARML